MANLKWTIDALKASAAKYKTRGEWNKLEPNAYCAAKKRKLLDHVCTHMPKPRRWTNEKLKASAIKYRTREEWAKEDPAAYRTARSWKIMDEVAPHIPPRRLWTIDTLKKSALKYKSRRDWQLHESNAYHSAHKRGLLDICCVHMKRLGNRKKRAIYAFEFKDKSVYVGLTHDLNKRKHQHFAKPTSKIMKIKFESSIDYEFKELTDYLDVDEAVRLESKILNTYIMQGWNSLNTSVTGSLGTNEIIWTLDKLKESSAKYKTRGEWQRGEPRAYGAAHKHGVLEECCSHMPHVRKSWNLEKLKASAKKYKTRKEWRTEEPSAYSTAKNRMLLDECCGHMKHIRKSWTSDKLKLSARKYKTKEEWRRAEPDACSAARKHGIFDECCEHMPERSNSKTSSIKQLLLF